MGHTSIVASSRTFSDVLDVGEGAALGEALRSHGIRAGDGGSVQHAVGNAFNATHRSWLVDVEWCRQKKGETNANIRDQSAQLYIKNRDEKKNGCCVLTGQAESREDVHVVALRRDLDCAVREGHTGKWAARGHNGRTVGPLVRVRRRALGLW